MNLIFRFSFLLLLPIQSFGQIRGYFCSSQIFSSSCINFLNEKEFEFDYSDCTRFSKGKGEYKLQHKKLILNFTAPKLDSSTSFVTQITKETLNDSINIKLLIFDKSSAAPLPFVITLIKSGDGKNISHAMTEENGSSSFTLPKTMDSVYIAIQTIGYSECIIPLIVNKDYRFEVGLRQGPIEWIAPGTSWKWKLKTIRQDSFITKGRDKLVFKKD